MGVLGSLTLDQKLKAFEKAKSEVGIPGAKLVLVTEEYYSKALQLYHVFFRDEPINRSIDMEWSDEVEAWSMTTLRDNLSLMLVDEDTGEPMAIRATRIIDKDQKFGDLDTVKDEKWKKLILFVLECEKNTNFFDTMMCTEALHFLGLCVAEKYRHRGLATAMFRAALAMIRHLEIDEVVIRGEGSSNYSKRVFEKFGFETLCEKKYSEFLVNGQQGFGNTGEHKSLKLYGTRVSSPLHTGIQNGYLQILSAEI